MLPLEQLTLSTFYILHSTSNSQHPTANTQQPTPNTLKPNATSGSLVSINTAIRFSHRVAVSPPIKPKSLTSIKSIEGDIFKLSFAHCFLALHFGPFILDPLFWTLYFGPFILDTAFRASSLGISGAETNLQRKTPDYFA